MRVHLLDEEHRVLIVGANQGGSTMLELLLDDKRANIVGIADRDTNAPGMEIAKAAGIPVFTDIGDACRSTHPSMALNLTNVSEVDALIESSTQDAVIVSGPEAKLMWRMLTRLKHDQSLVFRLVSRLKRTQEKQRYEASHDYLTDLYNRRFMMEQLHTGMAQALRYNNPYALIMMDIDHFKTINDTHGHGAGDILLKHFASCLRSNVRSADILGRFGGDEFLVLSPQTTVVQGEIAGSKWLGEMGEEDINIPGTCAIDITFSGGVAGYDGSSSKKSSEYWIDKMLAEADERLYQAKSSGRNCVIGSK